MSHVSAAHRGSGPHHDFAVGLHRILADAGGPSVWSPYSVASALSLAAAGARGATYEELSAALAPGGDLRSLARAMRSAGELEGADSAVANTLWAQYDVPFRDDYRQTALSWPGGGVQVADFRGDPSGACRAINTSVEKTTRRLVREIVGPDDIPRDTAAVLVNALYLAAGWMLPFPADATTDRPFLAPSGTRDVPTMAQRERMPYARTAGWRMVTLPAVGDVAADVLLPDDDLAAAERSLSVDTLVRLDDERRDALVDLRLPRFRVEARATPLNEPLRGLGVHAPFDPATADFSGISSTRLHLHRILHKAVLRVDERGLEGAATTAAVMRLVSAWTGATVDFHVDRPFLVLVRHAASGCLYFLARVTEP